MSNHADLTAAPGQCATDGCPLPANHTGWCQPRPDRVLPAYLNAATWTGAPYVVALGTLLAGCKENVNPTCDQLKRKVDSARRSAVDRPGDERRQRTYAQARQRYRNAACPGRV